MDVNQKIQFFKKSHKKFNELCLKISNIGIKNNYSEYEISLLNEYFHMDKYGVRHLANILLQTKQVLNKYASTNLKKQNVSDVFRKKYNQTILQFQSYLKDDTPFYAITTINKFGIPCNFKSVPMLTDILTLENFNISEPHLLFNDGSAIQCPDPTYFLNCLKAQIDKTTIENFTLNVDIRMAKFSLNFVHSAGTGVSTICADDKRIYKLLDFRIGDYEKYVTNHFKKLIRSEWNNSNFPYRYITCMKCFHEDFTSKCSMYTCRRCNFNMCGNGCGMYYHGNTPCDDNSISTQDIIKLFVNSQCPKCKLYIEKNFGCDHMTCPCGTHYCNKCGKEYVRDQYNHYIITEHPQTCKPRPFNILTKLDIQQLIDGKTNCETEQSKNAKINILISFGILIFVLLVSCIDVDNRIIYKKLIFGVFGNHN